MMLQERLFENKRAPTQEFNQYGQMEPNISQRLAIKWVTVRATQLTCGIYDLWKQGK